MNDGVKIKIKMFILSTSSTQCCPQLQFWVSHLSKKNKAGMPIEGREQDDQKSEMISRRKKRTDQGSLSGKGVTEGQIQGA